MTNVFVKCVADGTSSDFARCPLVGRYRRQSGPVPEIAKKTAFDPYVWSGRALQENFADLAVGGLAVMCPASHDGFSVKC